MADDIRVRLAKPRVYIRGHLLENISYQKSYLATKGHAGWLKIVDDTGKTIHLSKTIQREHFLEVDDGKTQ